MKDWSELGQASNALLVYSYLIFIYIFGLGVTNVALLK